MRHHRLRTAYPTFPGRPPSLRKSYRRTADEGTEFSPQPPSVGKHYSRRDARHRAMVGVRNGCPMSRKSLRRPSFDGPWIVRHGLPAEIPGSHANAGSGSNPDENPPRSPRPLVGDQRTKIGEKRTLSPCPSIPPSSPGWEVDRDRAPWPGSPRMLSKSVEWIGVGHIPSRTGQGATKAGSGHGSVSSAVTRSGDAQYVPGSGSRPSTARP